jgi:transcriptional regulator with XRE-family HTH domain
MKGNILMINSSTDDIAKEVENALLGFGARIKELRKLRGMTQKQLAEDIGVSYQALNGWENAASVNGKPLKELQRDNLNRLKGFPREWDKTLVLCKILDCDIDYLFGNLPDGVYKNEVAEVSAVTGLSPKAVEAIIYRGKELKAPIYDLEYDVKFIETLNLILEEQPGLLEWIALYLYGQLDEDSRPALGLFTYEFEGPKGLIWALGEEEMRDGMLLKLNEGLKKVRKKIVEEREDGTDNKERGEE